MKDIIARTPRLTAITLSDFVQGSNVTLACVRRVPCSPRKYLKQFGESLVTQSTFHRRYEALRAYFIEARPVAEVAARYNYKLEALKVMISQFRTQCRDDRLPPFSFVMGVGDRRSNHVAKTSMAPTKPQ